MTRRRSASSGRPLSSICTGAWKPSASRSVGHVVDLAVADDDGAGDAARRQIGDRRGQSGEQPRAAAVTGFARRLVAGMDDAKLQPGDRLDALLDLGQRGGGLRAARRHVLAFGIVDHDHGDIVQIFAVLRTAEGLAKRAPAARRRRAGARGCRAPGARRRSPAGSPPAIAAGHQQGPGQQRARIAMLRVPTLIGPASPGSPAHAPGRICNCRSAHTSRG